MATSAVPAGQTYRGVEHAGECTLAENADGFPDTDQSHMIPPLFRTQYPEPIDEKTGNILKTTHTLAAKEERRFLGISRNAFAEEAEYKVFKALEQLIQYECSSPLLAIRNYELTQNPSQNFRTSVLQSELGIDFGTLYTLGEFDALIAVKNIGVVLLEIKTRFTEEQHRKAEEQLEHGKLFFKRIMSHLTGSSCNFPLAKVIIFPEERSNSPQTKSIRGSHIVHKDLLMNFNVFWDRVIQDLHVLKMNSPFSSHDFRRFIRIITGIWCMEPYKKRYYKYNNEQSSSSFLLQHNDQMVNHAILTSDAKRAKDHSKIASPIVNVELCRPMDSFLDCKGLSVVYLTPSQKDLYQNFRQVVIRGCGGSGKTMICYLKIINILQNHLNKNLLIIVPEPHHLRFHQFLALNGVQATIAESFPSPVGSSVVIITLKNFFHVPPSILQSYDLSSSHILIDDLQSLDFYSTSRTSYDDVLSFVEQTYISSLANDVIFWCAVDPGQSRVIDVDGTRVTSMFNIDAATPRNLSIPIYTLKKNLRNSVEISAVVHKIRDMRIATEKASSVLLSNCSSGHRIRCGSVTYHKLNMWSGKKGLRSKDWKQHGYAFAVERLQEELTPLLVSQKYPMDLKDIAILHSGAVVVDPIEQMLFTIFNIQPQTIVQSITTNNNTVILDHTDNLASFECACVMYLCFEVAPGFCHDYNIMTRARTKLVVIDFDYRQLPPSVNDDIIMINWEEKNGAFHRM